MRQDPSFFEVPADLWDRPQTRQALADRDVGALFRLVGKYAGASQTGIGMRVGISQPEVNQIVRGRRRVSDQHVYERIADGLDMPTSARALLGLAPAHQPPPGAPRNARAGTRPRRRHRWAHPRVGSLPGW